jgi:hypothetical protein
VSYPALEDIEGIQSLILHPVYHARYLIVISVIVPVDALNARIVITYILKVSLQLVRKHVLVDIEKTHLRFLFPVQNAKYLAVIYVLKDQGV